MNREVKEILLPLCRGKRPDDHVWLNPKTGKPFDDIKKAFVSACEDAGIKGLVWHDLRAAYADLAALSGRQCFTRFQIDNLALSVRRGHADRSKLQLSWRRG